jgi:outer membrane lipoprotein LolB
MLQASASMQRRAHGAGQVTMPIASASPPASAGISAARPRTWRKPGAFACRFRLAIVAVLTLLLGACATAPHRDAAGWRAPDGVPPGAVDAFRLSGRLAVSDGRDGGSASFLWTQRGDAFEVELRQPVSQRTWRLSGDDRGAVLEGADDGPRRGASAEALLQEVLGWHVPVAALRDWVRGLPHAGGAVLERDEDGRAVSIRENGWHVQYRAWLDEGAWPTRIVARREPYSVRLSIHEWWIADAGN